MFYQFLPEILRLSRDQYANFVLQRLIENLSVDLVDSIADKVKKDALIMATNQYACRVLQSVTFFSFKFTEVGKNCFVFIHP